MKPLIEAMTAFRRGAFAELTSGPATRLRIRVRTPEEEHTVITENSGRTPEPRSFPIHPVIRTLASVGATCSICARSAFSAGLCPLKPPRFSLTSDFR